MDKMLTVKEVAKLYKYDISTIYKYIRKGKIMAEKIGNTLFISESELKRWESAWIHYTKVIKAPTGEVENDIHKLKVQVKENTGDIEQHAMHINSIHNSLKSHSDLIQEMIIKMDNLKDASKEFGERLNDLNDYDKHLHGRINQTNSQIGEIKEKMITYYDQLNGLLNTVKNYRTAFQIDLNYIDEVMKELADRITALQEKGIQPKTGLIRKFWRWLW
jgi:excisionase family DNA binding protein